MKKPCIATSQSPPGHRVRWDVRLKEIVFCHDGTVDMEDGSTLTAGKATGGLLHNAFNIVPVFEGKSLIQELESRGYDLTTFRFEIRMKRRPR